MLAGFAHVVPVAAAALLLALRAPLLAAPDAPAVADALREQCGGVTAAALERALAAPSMVRSRAASRAAASRAPASRRVLRI